MHSTRRGAIEKAASAKRYGIVLGTLGRQGNPKTLEILETRLQQLGIEYVVVLLSEIFPDKLKLISEVEAWIQIACPRLSIDWGYAFSVPLLNPYEASVALGMTTWQEVYPMDYYAKEGGVWSASYGYSQMKT